MSTDDFEQIVTGLSDRGWSVVPGFAGPAEVVALLEDERVLWEGHAFRPAGVGRGAETAVHHDIRGDRICWLEPGALPPAVSAYWDKIERLRLTLNESLYLGLREFEAHFAVYPPGTFYKKHLDQHRGTPKRIISCLLYLNRDWAEGDGGELRLYEGDGFTDILPAGGTFVCFRSDLILHEVLPTRRERVSLTGWLRRA